MKAMNIDWLSNCPACGHSQAMVKTEKGRQDWLYVWHKGRWPLVLDVPFQTQGKAVDAAIAFNFDVLYK
ncbi:hypothetical protein [Serratia marcescens]|uniref:hypothetical protein n=1 Tax=Serratia marcescens TaxID=615 RepID=UPI001F153C5D|nr:hypothetical protein [Serratia marcescens]